MGRRSPSLDDSVRALQPFTACDISDALARLKVPGAGYLADLSLVGQPDHPVAPKTIAPASTVLFAPKEGDTSSPPHVCNIPEGAHWADLAEPGTIVLLKQPGGQRNAVCGGILAQRMKVRGVVAIVAAGRVRDVAELRSTGLPVWARGLSAVGGGFATVPRAVQVPLEIDDTIVRPGDLVVCDAINGVVVIPIEKLSDVLELLPRLTSADDQAKNAVTEGMSVSEAFRTFRDGR